VEIALHGETQATSKKKRAGADPSAQGKEE
jgi:hypothetical protein